MIDLSNYFVMVENSLFDLRVDPTKARTDRAGKWHFYRGSAEIWIDIWYNEKLDRAYFQVVAPAIPIPDSRKETFFKELLEYNDKMFGVAFTIYKDWAFIKEIREVDGLDQNEVLATINRIAMYCDKYDDLLKLKYGIPPEFPGMPPIN